LTFPAYSAAARNYSMQWRHDLLAVGCRHAVQKIHILRVLLHGDPEIRRQKANQVTKIVKF
jgi:hypothetical protein